MILRLKVKISFSFFVCLNSQVRSPWTCTWCRGSTDEECDPLHGPLAERLTLPPPPPASPHRRLTWLAERSPVQCAQHQQQHCVRVRGVTRMGLLHCIRPWPEITQITADKCPKRCLMAVNISRQRGPRGSAHLCPEGLQRTHKHIYCSLPKSWEFLKRILHSSPNFQWGYGTIIHILSIL